MQLALIWWLHLYLKVVYTLPEEDGNHKSHPAASLLATMTAIPTGVIVTNGLSEFMKTSTNFLLRSQNGGVGS